MGGSDTDAFDRAIQSIERHTARTIADAQAVGLGAGAMAEARAQAQLLTAAQQAGIPITDKIKDQMQDLAQDAGDAALALAKAKTAIDIKFGRDTAFLSQEDVSIAQQLKQIYPDVADALKSSDAEPMKVSAFLKAPAKEEKGNENERVQHPVSKAA